MQRQAKNLVHKTLFFHTEGLNFQEKDRLLFRFPVFSDKYFGRTYLKYYPLKVSKTAFIPPKHTKYFQMN